MTAASFLTTVDRFVAGPEHWGRLPAGGVYAAARAQLDGGCEGWDAWEPVLERLGRLLCLCASVRIPVHHPTADLAATRAEQILGFAADRGDPAGISALLDGAEVLLGDAVRALDARAKADVARIAATLAQVDPNRGVGVAALARAIARLDADAPPVAGLRASLPQIRALAEWASSLAAATPDDDASVLERSEGSVRLWKAAALLASEAGFVGARETVALDAEWSVLSAKDQCIDRLNALYYCTKGTAIYGDFWTLVNSSSYLAHADAQAFRARVVERVAAGHELPEHLRVIEVGVGDGRFGADFLDALAALDRGAGDGVQIYPRLRYFMVDLSEAMLRGVAQNPRVMKHHERLKLLCCDAAAIRELGTFHFIRFHELFADLDRTGIVYVDHGGQAHEVHGRLMRYADATLLGPAGEPRSHEDLARALAAPNASDLPTFRQDTLEQVETDMKLEPVDLASYDGGDLLVDLVGDRRGVALSMPHGGLEFLEVLLSALDPDMGALRIFDYGFSEVPKPQSYSAIAQVIRTYGGQPTHNVNFPVLAARAEQRGFKASVRSVGAFCRDTTGARAFVGRFAVPLTGPVGHAAFSRGEGAPFPLEGLGAFPRIEALAAEHVSYESFVEALKTAGLIPPVWSCHPHPGTGGLLDNLALDLELTLNALFRRVVVDAEKAGRVWITGDQLARLEDGLARLGFAPGADVLDRLWRSPEHKEFLVLEVVP